MTKKYILLLTLFLTACYSHPPEITYTNPEKTEFIAKVVYKTDLQKITEILNEEHTCPDEIPTSDLKKTDKALSYEACGFFLGGLAHCMYAEYEGHCNTE